MTPTLSSPSSRGAISAAAYPRPQLVRDRWASLDGDWSFSTGDDARTIRVPFAPETPASGLALGGYIPSCTYRREFDAPALGGDDRLLIHFEAVDYVAGVFVNDAYLGTHEGGYTRFSFDATDALRPGGPQSLRVEVEDDPHDLAKPRGKQDWLPEAHAIWYPRTTGIWQSVWTEVVPATRIASLRWTADPGTWSIACAVRLNACVDEGTRVRVRLSCAGKPLADDAYLVSGDEATRVIVLRDGGIDSVRDELYWMPGRPRLIDALVTLESADCREIDRVASYTAMRSVSTLGDRLMINGRATELRMMLDQGYWPETGLTPPDDAAIVRDIELTLAMGFNGVRKHQKIETERYLYHADRMGLLVWEEMPSAYRFCADSVRRVTRQWQDAIERDASHPCIVAWVPINESWAVPDVATRADQRAFVESLYFLTKSLDPTRPVVSNDGWEMTRTDLLNVHDYDHDPKRLARRYDPAVTPTAQMLLTERPGPRQIVLDAGVYTGQPMLLTEFGGIAFADASQKTWGYSVATDADDLARRYARLLLAVRSCRVFSGFCYTQFTDTYQEANGLVTMDRRPKFDVELVRIATRGVTSPAEQAKLDALLAD